METKILKELQLLNKRMTSVENNMATMRKEMVTKKEIKNMATKDDIKNMATKDDIKSLKEDLVKTEKRLIRRMNKNKKELTHSIANVATHSPTMRMHTELEKKVDNIAAYNPL